MPSANLLNAGQVMNTSAVLNNDPRRRIYTYEKQIPHLNVALRELELYFELHSVAVTETTTSTPIQVNAGDTTLTYQGAAGGTLQLPEDMVEPQQLWERTRNIDPFVPMTRREYLPHYLEGQQTNLLVFWVWQKQEIKFLPSNQNNDVKIDYIRRLFTPIINEISPINVINAQSFLEFRTAALCADFIGEDSIRAQKLNGFAIVAKDEATGITVKGKQTIVTRRRPFRGAWKSRSNLTS